LKGLIDVRISFELEFDGKGIVNLGILLIFAYLIYNLVELALRVTLPAVYGGLVP
jgi:hypothetical protein